MSGIAASENLSVIKKLQVCLKSVGLRSLLRLCQEYSRPDNIEVDEAAHKKNSNDIIRCIVIQSTVTELLKNNVSYGSIIVKITGQSFLHHIAAAGSDYGCASGKFGVVMVEANNAQTISTCR